MNEEYIKKLEEENAALRLIINKLEDENSLCNMWKPRWSATPAGTELIIGKYTSLGDVAFANGISDGNGDWGVYVNNNYIRSFRTRADAKNYLIKRILEEKNGQ